MAATLQDNVAHFIHLVRPEADRPQVLWAARHALSVQTPAQWTALRSHPELRRTPLVLVLPADHYRVMALEAPDLPRADWADALRWRLKDSLDFPADTASIAVLAVPGPHADTPARNALAVAASAEHVQPLVERCADACLPLQAIDIVETGLRNLCSLAGDEPRARALLWLGQSQTQLVVSLRGDLLLSRRIEVGGGEWASSSADDLPAMMERVALEVQRTLDVCERLFGYANVAGLSLVPHPQAEALAHYLSGVVYLPVSVLPLRDLIDFGAVPELAASDESLSQHAVALGAALRDREDAS